MEQFRYYRYDGFVGQAEDALMLQEQNLPAVHYFNNIDLDLVFLCDKDKIDWR